MKNFPAYLCAGLLALALPGCKDSLDVEPSSEFAPTKVLTSEAGLRAVLFSAYAAFQNQEPSRFVINDSEMCTDMAFDTGGGENGILVQIINFRWDPSLGTFAGDLWNPAYRAIRDANIVLENVASIQAPEATKKLFAAEARFLRATSYAQLYSWFGPVPLRTSGSQETNLARASDEEMRAFIAEELTEILPDLPAPGQEVAFGRATRGAALGVLAKFYLNSKQWQPAADAAQAVTDLGYYSLFPSFPNLFRIENKGNKEMILVWPCRNEAGYGNWFTAGALPPAFKSTPQIPDYVFVPGVMSNFATQYRLRSDFVRTFAPADQRGQLVLKSYVNLSGATVDLLATPDNARSLKYWDNSTLGNNSATDVPLIRYADILLTRAEALNEVGGPTPAAQALLNQVRQRAGLADLPAAEAASKETFRDAILRERGWEFVSEAKRREDLIRHGKLISSALARGIAGAAPKHVLFPIPQAETSANPAVVQNEGY